MVCQVCAALAVCANDTMERRGCVRRVGGSLRTCVLGADADHHRFFRVL